MMKKIFTVIPSVLLLPLLTFAQAALEKITLLDNKVEMVVPNGVIPVETNLLESHSPEYDNKLHLIIAENSKQVTLAYQYSDILVDDNGIPGFTDQLISLLKVSHDEIKLKDDGILLQDGKNIGFIKSTYTERDKKNYNYLFYLSVHNRLLLFSFTCPKKAMKKWESATQAMASSIRVKL